MDAKRWSYNFDVLDIHAGQPHCVDRSKIFDDIIALYESKLGFVLQESPFRIRFAGEKAVDIGGVSRDMFSAFWDETYLQLFDGGSNLIPAIHSGIDIKAFPILGTILSHGYLTCGFLPIRIAFPVLAAIVFGPTIHIPANMVIDSFADFLSTYEGGFVSKALSIINTDSPFPEDLVSKLTDILSRLGCHEMPKNSTFKRVLAEVAIFTFITKCMGALYALHSGVPATHKDFWKGVSIEELYKLYKVLVATPHRVLSLIKEPEFLTAGEGRVFNYLTLLIGDMKQKELSALIRFITGSSVLIANEITITFNSLDGLARRPISSTCSCTLELPTTYTSYQEFSKEFYAVLQSDICSTWAMDAI